jgi:hypothetical protein
MHSTEGVDLGYGITYSNDETLHCYEQRYI